MRRSTAFSKVMPMGSGSLRGASSPRKSVVARLRLRASTVLAMQRLNPFAHRQRRRRRRRSATTDQIVSTQHASALSAVSMRSDDREQEARTRRALETARRTASGHTASSKAPAEYLVGLSTFFFACDYDEDGALSQTELHVMLEVLLTQDKTARKQNHKHRKASRKRRRTVGEPTKSPGGSRSTLSVAVLFEDDEEDEAQEAEAAVRGQQRVPLEQFMDKYGHRLFARGVELPSVDFVRRCQRLKVGFKRCDTNGDNVMSVQELEIALQKLDLVVADDDLQQLVASLDANGDGAIEWGEMVRAAWLNTHLGPARNRNSVLLLDALADVPAAAIGRPHYIKSAAGSTASVHAAGRPESPGAKSKNKIRKPTWLLRAALRMHLVLPQDARRSAGNSAGENDATAAASSQPRGPSKSRVERLGVRILTRISMQQVQAMKRGQAPKGRRSATSSPTRADARPKPKPRAVSTPKGPTNVAEASAPTAQSARTSTTIARTRLTVAMRRRVVRIEWIATALAALVGVACGLLSIRLEAFVPRVPGQDEFSGDTWYYVYVAAINVAVSLVEVNLMYLAAVVCAFRMTVATRLTLYPQDAEREFLTRAIARAALQVGHRKDALFGMDPMKDSPRLVLLCSFLLYRSKRYILKFLIKLFIRRVLWRAAAKTVLSVLVLPLNAVLNAWTLHRVMRHCRVTIIGPPCITALLEEFFARQEPKLLPYQRVDYLRVLGCALVCKRCVHPNLEIVVHQVRHKWVTAAAWPIGDGCSCLLCPDEPCELHELDDTDRFLASLLLDTSRLSPATAAASICQVLDVDHQRNIFFFLILALIVDGELSLGERRLYMRACQIAHMECDWAAVRRLKDEFLHGYGLRLDGMFEIIVPRPTETQEEESLAAPWLDWLLYVGDRVSSLLAV